MAEKRQQAGKAESRAPQFGTLIASKPKREGSAGFLATATSLITHAALVALAIYVTMGAGHKEEADEPHEVVTMVEVIDEPIPPPPPPPPEPDEPPPEAMPDVPKGFLTLTPPDVVLKEIPPPQVGKVITAADFSGVGVEGGRADGKATDRVVTTEDIGSAPVFTPMTTPPALRNGPEVERALQRSYPALLRDAGIGGQTVMWFFIDEKGTVINTKVHQGSGYSQLDEAASQVARLMRFTPAKNRDKIVPVWVQIPITFSAK
jgi:protein TonB